MRFTVQRDVFAVYGDHSDRNWTTDRRHSDANKAASDFVGDLCADI